MVEDPRETNMQPLGVLARSRQSWSPGSSNASTMEKSLSFINERKFLSDGKILTREIEKRTLKKLLF